MHGGLYAAYNPGVSHAPVQRACDALPPRPPQLHGAHVPLPHPCAPRTRVPRLHGARVLSPAACSLALAASLWHTSLTIHGRCMCWESSCTRRLSQEQARPCKVGSYWPPVHELRTGDTRLCLPKQHTLAAVSARSWWFSARSRAACAAALSRSASLACRPRTPLVGAMHAAAATLLKRVRCRACSGGAGKVCYKSMT